MIMYCSLSGLQCMSPLHASMSVDMATSSTLSACKLALHPFWNHTNLLEAHWLRFPQSHVSFLRLKTKNLCNCFRMVNNDSGLCRGIERGFRVPNPQLTRAKNQSMILIVHSPNLENGWKRCTSISSASEGLLVPSSSESLPTMRMEVHRFNRWSSHLSSLHWIISGYLATYLCFNAFKRKPKGNSIEKKLLR